MSVPQWSNRRVQTSLFCSCQATVSPLGTPLLSPLWSNISTPTVIPAAAKMGVIGNRGQGSYSLPACLPAYQYPLLMAGISEWRKRGSAKRGRQRAAHRTTRCLPPSQTDLLGSLHSNLRNKWEATNAWASHLFYLMMLPYWWLFAVQMLFNKYVSDILSSNQKHSYSSLEANNNSISFLCFFSSINLLLIRWRNAARNYYF